MEAFVWTCLIGLGALLCWGLVRLLKTPIRLALKLLLHALAGFVGLGLFNLIGGPAGLSLGLNWINALVTGVLGLPGLGLLVLIKYIVL